MVGGEGGNLGNMVAAPVRIYKIFPTDGQCQTDDITPIGVEVLPEHNPHV